MSEMLPQSSLNKNPLFFKVEECVDDIVDYRNGTSNYLSM